jgi:hypothetical protein
MDNNDTRSITWSNELEDLIAKEGERCASFIWLHRECEKRANYYNQCLTLPAIILGTVNGSISVGSDAIFGNLSAAPVIIGFVGILTSILGTVNNFYNNAKKAENHRICALQYEKINRLIMIELSLSRLERQQPDFLIKLIKSDFDQLNEIAPPIPDEIIAKYKLKFNNTEVTKPSICNGLDKILINRLDTSKVRIELRENRTTKENKPRNVRLLSLPNQPYEA